MAWALEAQAEATLCVSPWKPYLIARTAGGAFGIEVDPDDFENVSTLGEAQSTMIGYLK